MKEIGLILAEVYQQMGGSLSTKFERTKKYLNELRKWGIETKEAMGVIAYKPDNEYRNHFQVRLVYDKKDGLYEIKFGDLNNTDIKKQFKWDENDPSCLHKALFIKNVLEDKVYNLLKTNKIKGLKFKPYNEDGLGEDRLSYFNSMFKKLNKDEFVLIKTKDYDGDEIYKIIKKINN